MSDNPLADYAAEVLGAVVFDESPKPKVVVNEMLDVFFNYVKTIWPGTEISCNHFKVAPGTSFDQDSDLVEMMMGIDGSHRFWIGDILNQLEDKWKDGWTQFFEERTGKKFETLRVWRTVTANLPYEIRKDPRRVPFSKHRLIASMRSYLLKAALLNYCDEQYIPDDELKLAISQLSDFNLQEIMAGHVQAFQWDWQTFRMELDALLTTEDEDGDYSGGEADEMAEDEEYQPTDDAAQRLAQNGNFVSASSDHQYTQPTNDGLDRSSRNFTPAIPPTTQPVHDARAIAHKMLDDLANAPDRHAADLAYAELMRSVSEMYERFDDGEINFVYGVEYDEEESEAWLPV